MTREGGAVTPEAGLEGLLDELERTIGRLADGSAPLEELVTAHERAVRLLEQAQARLDELSAWAARS